MRRPPLAALLALPPWLIGCLPGDTRPTPGRVYVTTEAAPTNVDGVATDDGWQIDFERLLVGLGNVDLEGASCNKYSEARYSRLFDFTIEAEPQKVGLAYGLGDCRLEIGIRPPSDDAAHGVGITSADVETMRREVLDPWVDEPERTSVYVVGTASRDGEQKRFEWSFRERYNMENCQPGENGELGSDLDIAGDDDLQMTVILHGEELFRASDAADAPLRFDELAAADADLDGEVTLVELDELDAPPLQDPEEDEDAEVSVAKLIYETLVERMARFAGGGVCEGEDRGQR